VGFYKKNVLSEFMNEGKGMYDPPSNNLHFKSTEEEVAVFIIN
jgi:hypothetical protein